MNSRSVGFWAYQQPPGPSRRSNTLITSNVFSCARASTAMAPEGPAPMTATRLTGILGRGCVSAYRRYCAAREIVPKRIALEQNESRSGRLPASEMDRRGCLDVVRSQSALTGANLYQPSASTLILIFSDGYLITQQSRIPSCQNR